MRHHPLIASLMRTPWAILEQYLPLVASVLARIASGEPLSAADRAHITERRSEWRHAHPSLALEDEDYGARRESDPYTSVSASGGSSAIAVIGMYGVLTQRGGFDIDTSEPLTSTARLAHAVKLAAADPQISGIVLDVDSPGGSVYGISELADAIYGARQAKPIAAVANSLAASAAYWVAVQAEELYTAPGAEVGSIGVYTIHTCIAEFLKRQGIAVEMISAGKYKTEGNPYGPLPEDARAHIQSTVLAYHEAFVRAVARGRGTTQKAVREGMGQGRVLLPDAAKAEGMIDGVATLDQVITKMQARARRGSKSGSASPTLTRAAVARQLAIWQLE